MKKINLILTLCLVLMASKFALADNGVFFVGHSLVNHNMPRMVQEIANSLGHSEHFYKEQIINGSPLKNSWTNSSGGENGINFKVDYSKQAFNQLVITEAVPLDNHLLWNNSYFYAQQFCSSALNHNPSSECYLYETWHCLKSGTPEGCAYDDGSSKNSWRERLDLYWSKWKKIADSVSVLTQSTSFKIIPAGQAMARLYDSLSQGKLAGYTQMSQFFSDDIHPNDLGNYYVALVQYATLYKKSPVGAKAQLKNQYGVDYNIPYQNQSLIEQLQKMAWATVCKTPESGVTCDQTKTLTRIPANQFTWNRVNNQIHFESLQNRPPYQIFNLNGEFIQKGVISQSGVISLPQIPGIYILKLGHQFLEMPLIVQP